MIPMDLIATRVDEKSEWTEPSTPEKVIFMGWQGDDVMLCSVPGGLITVYPLRNIKLRAQVSTAIQPVGGVPQMRRH